MILLPNPGRNKRPVASLKCSNQPVRGPTQPPYSTRRVFFMGRWKQPGHAADRSPPASTKVNSKLSYTSATLTWIRGVARDNFTVYPSKPRKQLSSTPNIPLAPPDSVLALIISITFVDGNKSSAYHHAVFSPFSCYFRPLIPKISYSAPSSWAPFAVFFCQWQRDQVYNQLKEGISRRGVKLATQLHLISRWRMSAVTILNNPWPCTEKLDMVTKEANLHKCTNASYIIKKKTVILHGSAIVVAILRDKKR